MNKFKTFALMAGLTALFAMIGNALGGQSGMFIAFGLAVAMNFFSYWFSDKIVLKMYGANEVKESEAPELYGMVRNLATRAKLRPVSKVAYSFFSSAVDEPVTKNCNGRFWS